MDTRLESEGNALPDDPSIFLDPAKWGTHVTDPTSAWRVFHALKSRYTGLSRHKDVEDLNGDIIASLHLDLMLVLNFPGLSQDDRWLRGRKRLSAALEAQWRLRNGYTSAGTAEFKRQVAETAMPGWVREADLSALRVLKVTQASGWTGGSKPKPKPKGKKTEKSN
jgi:hypothetical protein